MRCTEYDLLGDPAAELISFSLVFVPVSDVCVSVDETMQ